MTKETFQPPGNPFPPTIIEAEAIINIGLMFGHILILLVITILMIYYSKRTKNYITIIIIYLFSLVISVDSFLHIHTPFSPMFEIFILLFNSSLFIHSAIDYYTLEKKKREN